MEQYISKAALAAEIKKIKSHIGSDKYLSDYEKGCNFGREDVCDSLLNFIDTLEVKEVDLEKEATEFVQTKEFVESKESPVLLIAKHFYELGLTQKGE